MSNCIKIRRLGAELYRADGQTDMTKLIVAFRSFANAPKSHFSLLCLYFCVLIILALPFVRTIQHTTQSSMLQARFEPAIPAGERLQIYALDRAAMGIGRIRFPDRPARRELL
jgi:hypothetical protein